MNLKTPETPKKQIGLWVVLCFFLLLYSLISLVNHYQFRTYALDLGMFNQALHAYAHGQSALFTLDIAGRETPFLATHFSPITLLYAPFYYLFGTYTLLIIQIISVLFGGLGIYKIALKSLGEKYHLALLIIIQFLTCWGIFSALSFDFHNNVIGAMLIPWFIYYASCNKKNPALIFAGLILASHETMAIWLIFIIIGWVVEKRKQISKADIFRFYLPLFLFCICYGLVVILCIMPSLQNQSDNLQLTRYGHIGNSATEIIVALISNPVESFRLLFANTTGDTFYDGIKSEFYKVWILSGGILLFLRPAYLIMILPVLTLKMLSNDYSLWGINYQYSIEFIPIISIALVSFLAYCKRGNLAVVSVVLLSTSFFTFKTFDEDYRVSLWYNPQNAKFYDREHYTSDFTIKEVRKGLALIPQDASVSTFSRLAPHIAFREKLYHFPVVKDAEYILFDQSGNNSYPLSKEKYLDTLQEYKNSTMWQVFYTSTDLLILKRK